MRPYYFIISMMAEVHKRYPTMTMVWCAQWSIQTVREFMKSEKIRFGDDRYDWTRAGAIDLVDAFDYP